MARPTKPQALAIQARRNRVAQQYLRGVPQAQIAQQEGVDPKQISRDLAVIRREWQERRAADYEAKLDEEIARVNRLETVAWAAWERSCKDAETRHEEVTKGRVAKDGSPLPDFTKSRRTLRGQAGDPRFLDRVGWCIETRLKLMGALRQDVAAGNTTVVTVVNGIDLGAVTGQKPGIPYERLHANPDN